MQAMTPERYERLCQFFDQAQPLASAERAAFLDEACGEDLALRAEVEKLLAHDQRARGEQLFEEPCPLNAKAFLPVGEGTTVTALPPAGELEDDLVAAGRPRTTRAIRIR